MVIGHPGLNAVVEGNLKTSGAPAYFPEIGPYLTARAIIQFNGYMPGIFAEMNPEELSSKERARVEVFGLNAPFICPSNAPETPGPFFFAPIAAWIPAAARLMLAVVERLVADAGGTYAFCDTDSMAPKRRHPAGLLQNVRSAYRKAASLL